MNRLVMIVPAWLLAASLAAAQALQFTRDATPLAPAPSQAQKAALYEDIEIMRRLLYDKLQSLYPASARVDLLQFTDTPLLRLEAPVSTLGDLGIDTTLRDAFDVKKPLQRHLLAFPDTTVQHQLFSAKASCASCHATGYLGGNIPHDLTHIGLAAGAEWGRRLPLPDGVYLKGYGVVYTMTLPPPEPSASKPSEPAPKPLSDWERVRKQIRGEKVEAADKSQEQKKPTVADVILQVLAENGHHFSQLADNESLTVVVTFRQRDDSEAADARQVGRLGTLAGEMASSIPATGPPDAEAGGDNAKSAKAAANSTGQQTPPATGGVGPRQLPPAVSSPSSAGDYELLGDLHLKHGRAKDAIQAYQKAAEKNPDAQHAAAMYLKIANIYLTEKKDEAAAGKAMDQAREILNRPGASTAKPAQSATAASAVPSPRKLIISAPKALLDRAGAGKISFEEFKRAATVEYVAYSPTDKKPRQKPSR